MALSENVLRMRRSNNGSNPCLSLRHGREEADAGSVQPLIEQGSRIAVRRGCLADHNRSNRRFTRAGGESSRTQAFLKESRIRPEFVDAVPRLTARGCQTPPCRRSRHSHERMRRSRTRTAWPAGRDSRSSRGFRKRTRREPRSLSRAYPPECQPGRTQEPKWSTVPRPVRPSTPEA